MDELNTQNTLEVNHLSFLKKHHSMNDYYDVKLKRARYKILDKYNFIDIDFMNIDVEGHDLDIN